RDPSLARPPSHGEAGDGPQPLIPDDALHHVAPSWRRNLGILTLGCTLWLLPVGVALALSGRHSVFTEQGLFFSGTALVTFGGAYAVLAFVAQKAVATYGWLTGGEMVRGLALAETTPGPLIMVLQFVAFLGAYRDPGSLNPWVAAVLASLLTTWVTFVPSFLFIFLGAPYVERLRENRALAAALAGVTAAVVGVIANLALYFAVHTLFDRARTLDLGPVSVVAPVWSSYSWETWTIATVAMVLVFALKWPVLRVLGACALLGLGIGLAT
ncbi:chromate transporter, partial [Nocardia salmonicida]|uniref:chromate transporter n=1 Tax=Nocardia salmonicida TaxID=53431 RepID=UPI0033F10A2E